MWRPLSPSTRGQLAFPLPPSPPIPPTAVSCLVTDTPRAAQTQGDATFDSHVCTDTAAADIFFPSPIRPLLITEQNIQSQVRMFLGGEIEYSPSFLNTQSPLESHRHVIGRKYNSILLTGMFGIPPCRSPAFLTLLFKVKATERGSLAKRQSIYYRPVDFKSLR